MEFVALSEVCEIIAGQSPPSKFYNKDGDGLPFFQGKADFGELHPSVRMWCSEPKKIAEAGDILISVRAPVGPTNLADEQCCIGRGLSAIRPSAKVDTKFLLFYLRFVEPRLSSQGRGSTFSAITQKELRAIAIPLPPLPEQQRIAAILDKADALRAKRRAALAKLDTLLQATFLDMFGDPVTNPMGWEVVPLGDLGDDKKAIVDGPFGSAINVKSDYSDTGDIPVIRTKNVKSFRFVTKDLKYITRDKFEEVKRSEVLPGDVILTKVGTIGNVCIFPDTFDRAVLSTTGSCRIRGNSRIVENVFLLYYLHNYQREMLRIASTGVQAFLNMKHIKSFKVPLPDIELQANFSMKEKQINQYRKYHEEALLKLDNLFHALQQRAFKGEL